MPSSDFAASENPSPIFVFACCQRSGSTLLQRLLNSHPDILIWGEHAGYLNNVADGYNLLMDWKQRHDHSAHEYLAYSRNVFMPNAVPDRPDLDHSFREHIRALFPVPRQNTANCAWGFKEVRYLLWIAKFLQDLFPQAKIIHVIRNIDSCMSSMKLLEQDNMWEREWTDEALMNWVKVNQSFVEFSGFLNNYLPVRYEDLVSKHSEHAVDRVERFVGVAPGTLDKMVLRRHVDLVPHGPRRYAMTDEDRALLAQPEVVALKAHFGY